MFNRMERGGSNGPRHTSMLSYGFLLLLAAAAAPGVTSQSLTVTFPTATVTSGSSAYTWSSSTTYTPTTLQVPITATAATSVRIVVTRTASSGLARLQGSMIITNNAPSQATLGTVLVTAAGATGSATCTPLILPGPGATSSCSFNFQLTTSGTFQVGAQVQFTPLVGGLQLYSTPPGAGPTLDPSTVVAPPGTVCATVTQTFSPTAGTVVTPYQTTGNLPGTGGRQICESTTFDGVVVFGNFPATVTSGLREGTTPGTCTPILQATDTTTVTSTDPGASPISRQAQLTITATGCSNPLLTATLSNLQAAAAAAATPTWSLTTTVSPSSVTLGSEAQATFSIVATKTEATAGVPAGVALTGNVVVNNPGAQAATVSSVAITANDQSVGTATCASPNVAPGASVTCTITANLPAGAASYRVVAVARSQAGAEARSEPSTVVPQAVAGGGDGCAALTDTLSVTGNAPPDFNPAVSGQLPSNQRLCQTQTVTYTTAFVLPTDKSRCGTPFTVSNKPSLTPNGGQPKTATATVTVIQPCANGSTSTATPPSSGTPTPGPTPSGTGSQPTSPLSGTIQIASVNRSRSSKWQVQISTVPASEVVLYGGPLFGQTMTAQALYTVRYTKTEPGQDAVVTGEIVLSNAGGSAVDVRMATVLLDGVSYPALCTRGAAAGAANSTADSAASSSNSTIPPGGSLRCNFTANLIVNPRADDATATAAVTTTTGVTIPVAPRAVSPGVTPVSTYDPNGCVTVGFKFLEGEPEAGAVWLPEDVSPVRGVTLPAEGVTEATRGLKICSSSQSSFNAVFGPVGTRACGTYQVPSTAVAWGSNLIASTRNALFLRAVDCAPTQPGTGAQPQRPDSLFPGFSPSQRDAASPNTRAAAAVSVALVDTSIQAGSPVQWQISSEPAQSASSLQLGKAGQVQFDLAVQRSDPKEYILSGSIQLQGIGNSNSTVVAPQVFIVNGAGSDGGNATSKATVECPGGSSQILRVTAGSTLVCSYTLSTTVGAGRLQVVVERLLDGRTAGMVNRTIAYRWEAAKDPNGVGCAQLYMGSIVGQPLVAGGAPVTALAQGSGPRFAEAADALEELTSGSEASRLEKARAGSKAGQSVRVCGRTSFKVAAKAKAGADLRCRSYKVVHLAELQIPGAEPSVLRDSSTATITLQGCRFDVSAFDVDGSFSNIFGVDVAVVRYMVNARNEQLQPVLTKTYSWTTSLAGNVTKDGQIKQPYNKSLAVGYSSMHMRSEPVFSVNVTGKFRLSLPASGPADKRKDQKWPGSMQVLLSDASGTSSSAPVNCTPTPSTTSLLTPLSCTFTASNLNPAVTSSGTPTFLAQLLLTSTSAQTQSSGTSGNLYAEPFVTQSTGAVRVVEKGACAMITAKWKAEPVAAGKSGAGGQKVSELKGTAVGIWPNPVKACGSTSYSYTLVLGPGDKSSCRTWQIAGGAGAAPENSLASSRSSSRFDFQLALTGC